MNHLIGNLIRNVDSLGFNCQIRTGFDEELMYGPLPAYDYDAELATLKDDEVHVVVKASASSGLIRKSSLKAGSSASTAVSSFCEDYPVSSLNFKPGCSSPYESAGCMSSPISDSLEAVVVGGPKRVKVGVAFFE